MAGPWLVADPVTVEATATASTRAYGDGGVSVVRSVGRVGSSPPGPSPFEGEDFAALRRRALAFEGPGSPDLEGVTGWGVDQQLWTTTPTMRLTAWEWRYTLEFHYTISYLRLPLATATRDALEMQLRVANPDAFGVEWEGNAPGSYAVQVVPQPTDVHEIQTWEGPTGPVSTDDTTPGDATAFHLLNLPALIDTYDGAAPPLTVLADPDLGGLLLGSAPANYPTAGVSPLPVPDTYLATYGLEDTGSRETIYGVAVAPYGAVGATAYGNPEAGTMQVAAIDVALAALYTPPRYRLLGLPTVTVSDDWLRVLQRSDGLDLGGPPRAVQRATTTDSVRAGTAVT